MKSRLLVIIGASLVFASACGAGGSSDSARTKNAALPTSSVWMLQNLAPYAPPTTMPAVTTTAPPVVTIAPTTGVPTTPAPIIAVLTTVTAAPPATTAAPMTAAPSVTATTPPAQRANASGLVMTQTITPNTLAPRVTQCDLIQKKVKSKNPPKQNVAEDATIYIRTTSGCPRFIASVEVWHENPSGRLDTIRSLQEEGDVPLTGNPARDAKMINDFVEMFLGGSRGAELNGRFTNFLTRNQKTYEECRRRFSFASASEKVPASCELYKLGSLFVPEVPIPPFDYFSEVALRSCRTWVLENPDDREKCKGATLVARIVFTNGYAMENIRIPLQ